MSGEGVHLGVDVGSISVNLVAVGADGEVRCAAWRRVDGAPVAAEYHLAGADTVYAYQSGIGPTQDCPSPGRLAHLATVRRAIAEGRRGFDFLRGDEAYKSHWRAVPHGTEEIRIVPPVLSARLRHGVRAAGVNVKEWLRSGLRLVGAREK